MIILQQLLTSFCASAGFGIIFQAPRVSIIKCGFVGMTGWIVYFSLAQADVDAVVATLAGAFVVAILSQIMARRYKKPSIIFSVMGIIPLVPGGLAYHATRNFVENEYGLALTLAAKAFMLSGAITLGLVCSEVIEQVWQKRKQKKIGVESSR
ncbi:hypothetical protein BEP19_04315 [Ammoniphilus oxalaticus]|uniref:Threonine/Serine exporter ThrE domain-containing protein n=1 Tax=Ammoniphilus oxalaticus TaxID=66863 RepID=A0A419SMC2_9BACL|nr:threonine/serine exporter family protein [Ammoniphilus oxalaticus]RKD25156.1 hypothetical protein BEP19_04315 [Ammoniphilus oxalaticus]